MLVESLGNYSHLVYRFSLQTVLDDGSVLIKVPCGFSWKGITESESFLIVTGICPHLYRYDRFFCTNVGSEPPPAALTVQGSVMWCLAGLAGGGPSSEP